jgi:hypothetical protein
VEQWACHYCGRQIERGERTFDNVSSPQSSDGTLPLKAKFLCPSCAQIKIRRLRDGRIFLVTASVAAIIGGIALNAGWLA